MVKKTTFPSLYNVEWSKIAIFGPLLSSGPKPCFRSVSWYLYIKLPCVYCRLYLVVYNKCLLIFFQSILKCFNLVLFLLYMFLIFFRFFWYLLKPPQASFDSLCNALFIVSPTPPTLHGVFLVPLKTPSFRLCYFNISPYPALPLVWDFLLCRIKSYLSCAICFLIVLYTYSNNNGHCGHSLCLSFSVSL